MVGTLIKVGRVKLNTNRASKVSQVRAGAGGLLHDSNGAWVAGFVANVGQWDAIRAELPGVFYGFGVSSSKRLQIHWAGSDVVYHALQGQQGFLQSDPSMQ